MDFTRLISCLGYKIKVICMCVKMAPAITRMSKERNCSHFDFYNVLKINTSNKIDLIK